ncbi:hypothetical protein O181_005753 [Austropuccinia psidii MF-1]|uniref:Uncharacterized protein n=1 Tax=Austropuccinia psidii MF-1 TaxID=1389203 RepID=A0A9Q3BIV5_9BASI|nr:hypothetical protein [Austropuccinia psidii MF-1]
MLRPNHFVSVHHLQTLLVTVPRPGFGILNDNPEPVQPYHQPHAYYYLYEQPLSTTYKQQGNSSLRAIATYENSVQLSKPNHTKHKPKDATNDNTDQNSCIQGSN